MTALAILDLGYGNVRSVALAFERLGAAPVLTNDPALADRAERLVIPGVGAAGTAMTLLRACGIDSVLARRTKPILGICLGMQLLFEDSAEDGGTKLLGILPGTVDALRPAPRLPVPHMGWSRLDCASGIGLASGEYAYFAHAYRCPDSGAIAARTRYGDALIPAALRLGNLWGAQFHPERSSLAGARFLKAFLTA